MDNLVDLIEAISTSSLDDEVKDLLKKAVIVEAQDKPLAMLERVIDEFLERNE